MKKKLRKLLTLLLSVMIIACFSLACAPSTPDNGDEGNNLSQHTHSYSAEYHHDNDYHWFECECGKMKDKSDHVFVENRCECGLFDPTFYTEGLVFAFDCVYDYTGSATEVIIPSIYKGEPVTTIGSQAFRGCTNLTSIVIPNNVISIDVDAFDNCTSLISITVDEENATYKSLDGNLYTKDGKTLIKYASGKTATSFVIPNHVTSIGDSAISECTSLTSIQIPDSVISIGEDVFWRCRSLIYNTEGNLKYLGNESNKYVYLAETTSDDITSATINSNCKIIGFEAFEYCRNLTSVEMPNSLISIGNNAFSECTNLISVEIPDSVMRIGDRAFENCSSSIYNIEGNLKYLGNENNKYVYLAGTTSDDITSAMINSNCKIIGFKAFEYCRSLTSVEMPNGLISIGGLAFSYCGKLTSIEIPGSVMSIGRGAFSYCRSLTSIEIPNSVIDIGNHVFSECTSLTSIVIPSSVTSIGEQIFWCCSSLTSIEIPNSITSINNEFAYCSSLTSVVIPNSVKVIDYDAFDECDNLKSITVDDHNKNFKSIDGNLYSKDGKILIKYSIGKNATSFTIPNHVTSIANGAFSRCSSLTSIKIPNSVTSIGNYAFSFCNNLTIYCEANNKPNGWYSEWNSDSLPVVWGYKD